MTDSPIIRECPLGGGITAAVRDATSHYFGGYYRVCLEISAVVPLAPECFDSKDDYEDAIDRLGEQVRFSRTLERMAVHRADLETARRELMASFDATMLPYLLRPDFPERFVRSSYRRSLTSSPLAFNAYR
jgi:hypothetical protein